MKIAMIAPAVPPKLDGIGDYSARIAQEIAKSIQIKVIVPAGDQYTPIVGAEIVPAYSLERRAQVWGMERYVKSAHPDWLFLQYNPFSFGRWGLNLSLPRVLQSIHRSCPATRIAVMVHEAYVPIVNWKFAIMTTWQRWQFDQICRAAHLLFFSVEQRAKKQRPRFPGKPMVWLPVGSNIPLTPISRERSRQILGVGDDVVVLGIFGMFHPERLFGHARRAALAVGQTGRKAVVLYLGPHGDRVRESLGSGVECIAEGRLEAPDISRRLAAVDVYLAPYEDGISTRRTTVMVGLQHGLPIVSTRGHHTDPLLLDAENSAFLLSPVHDVDGFCNNVIRLLEEDGLRRRIASGGRELFEANFSWPVIADRLISSLKDGQGSSNENCLAGIGS